MYTVEGDELFGHARDLVRGTPAAGHVLEPRRHPCGSLVERLAHEGAHPTDLFVGRRPLMVVAHHFAAHRPVPDHQHHVRPDALSLEQGALVTDRPR